MNEVILLLRWKHSTEAWMHRRAEIYLADPGPNLGDLPFCHLTGSLPKDHVMKLDLAISSREDGAKDKEKQNVLPPKPEYCQMAWILDRRKVRYVARGYGVRNE